MIVEQREGADVSDVALDQWVTAIHGDVLDDRGHAAVDEVQRLSGNAFGLRYDPLRLEVEFNGKRTSVDSLSVEMENIEPGTVVLEATTLGFVEVLLCCQVLRKLGTRTFDIVYVEPRAYRRVRRAPHLLTRRDFEISSAVAGYRAIPGSGILLREKYKGVFLLGYEEGRLRRAFEDLEMLQASRMSLVVGVPAFKPGWEMDSIANNIAVIREHKLKTGLYFCGAENPSAVVELLGNIHRSLAQDERLFVAPIGTKPHGVGTALFVSLHPDVGVLYDHPQRSQGRSADVGHWHLYSVRDHGAGAI